MSNSAHKRSGFTLVELLIVVSLIAILSGAVLGLINSSGVRQKTRDSQRIADIKKIQLALENYFAFYRKYPLTGNLAALSPSYIKDIPEDPLSGSYCYASNGPYYVVAVAMEKADTASESPCASLSSWSLLGGSCSLSNCYGKEGFLPSVE